MHCRWRIFPLAAAIAGCATSPNGAGDEETDDTDSDQEVPATAHWMADSFAAPEEVPLGRVLLPGGFNSTSYACAPENGISPNAPAVVVALFGGDDVPNDDPNRVRVVDWARTQDRSVGQQLLDGMRFVEINLTLKDGQLTTWHSIYGVPVGVVLDELVDFAAAWPDEVVVLTFGLDLEPADWPLLADALVAPRAGGKSVCDFIYDGSEQAALTPLSAFREAERNLVWGPEGDLRAYLEGRGDCPFSTASADRTWSITVSPEGVADALTRSVDSRDPNHLLINDFVFSLDGSASVIEQASYIGEHQGVQAASVALGFAGSFPGELIEAHNELGNMNIFAGAFYQDTNLVEAVLAENRARWGAP